MPERPCPRCHTLLSKEDSGMLLYCSHCGAPQVLLSEELREQAAESAGAGQASNTAAGNFAEASLGTLDAADPTAIDWTEAVRAAGLGGLIAFGLGLLSMAAPPADWLTFLWALIAPIVVLGIYSSRRKHTRIRVGFGARLGLVTGLAITAAMFTVSAVQLVFTRFILHRGASIDAWMTNFFTALQQRQTESGQPMPFNIAISEFRVGLLLASICFGICIYLGYSVISGAFGGLLRSPRRSA